MNARQRQYYIETIIATRKIWQGINELQALKKEGDAMDLGNTLPNGPEGSDFEHLTAEQLLSVVYSTSDALQTVLNAGHATNMARLL
jgi:hypothetical protein